MKLCTKFQGKRVSRYGIGARGTWQRMSFTYFASISPSNFSWHTLLNLVRSTHSFYWCCMFPFVIIFKKISIQKENTCYSITIGEQDYSQENSCNKGGFLWNMNTFFTEHFQWLLMHLLICRDSATAIFLWILENF